MSTWTFPHYECYDGHTVLRFDADDHGVTVAFCPDPQEAEKIVGALTGVIEHNALIGVLNGTHDMLRDIREKLDGETIAPPST